MHSSQPNLVTRPNLLTRDDTLFGVCQGLGEDLGLNPLLLRVPFAVLLLWNPVAVIATYAGLGAVVALTRWLSPEPRRAIVESGTAADVGAEAQADDFALAA
jgi:phage shock protein PspC (stress-responsive transcriptional regulator)